MSGSALPETVLSIETAVSGGSLSLHHGREEIARWVGQGGTSQAESIVLEIDTMLARMSLTLQHVDRLVCSAGPGSFTGIRIGIATAMGLKTCLSVRLSVHSILYAIADFHCGNRQSCAVIIPMGRRGFCLQAFWKEDGVLIELFGPRSVNAEDLNALHQGADVLFVHEDAVSELHDVNGIVNVGRNMARYLFERSVVHPDEIAQPLFISKTT
jgi:tRNA threonylcarbamoyl adenosine modification protein YeaZ